MHNNAAILIHIPFKRDSPRGKPTQNHHIRVTPKHSCFFFCSEASVMLLMHQSELLMRGSWEDCSSFHWSSCVSEETNMCTRSIGPAVSPLTLGSPIGPVIRGHYEWADGLQLHRHLISSCMHQQSMCSVQTLEGRKKKKAGVFWTQWSRLIFHLRLKLGL